MFEEHDDILQDIRADSDEADSDLEETTASAALAALEQFEDVPRDYRELSAKKSIVFVKASAGQDTSLVSTRDRSHIGESYLALVLPSKTAVSSTAAERSQNDAPQTCKVCKLPLELPSRSTTPHETSLVHQLALKHAHPPSSLDRNRRGFKYLEEQGWDPDSRLGLGARGEGIIYPVKTIEKKDRAGIGVSKLERADSREPPKKVQKMNAKEARRTAEMDRRKHEKLQRLFYSNNDLEKYLGPNA